MSLYEKKLCFSLALDVSSLSLPPSPSFVLEQVKFLHQIRPLARLYLEETLIVTTCPVLKTLVNNIFKLVPPVYTLRFLDVCPPPRGESGNATIVTP